MKKFEANDYFFKFSLMVFFVFILGCSNLKYEYIFKDTRLAPARVIFNQRLYDREKRLFLLFQNEKGVNTQVVRFNSTENKVDEVIFDIQDGVGKISECQISNSHLLFSVLEGEGEKAIQKIFIMKLEDKNSLELIFQKQSDYDQVYPLHACLANSAALWLDHNEVKKESFICAHYYDNEGIQVLGAYPFRTSGFELPLFFLSSDGEFFYHDVKSEDGIQILMCNITDGKIINRFIVSRDIEIHYCGKVNREKDFLALYAKNNRSELVYTLNLETGKEDKLIAFPSGSIIYDDLLLTIGNELAYPIQKNISDVNSSEIYVEFYDKESYVMAQVKDAFDVALSLSYRVYLKKEKTQKVEKRKELIIKEGCRAQVILQIFEK